MQPLWKWRGSSSKSQTRRHQRFHLKYGVQQKESLLEWGWPGDNNMGVILDTFSVNISPEMSCGVFVCDIVLLQNDLPMTLQ